MRDGLYRLRFQAARGWGAGVLHHVGGRIWGGDGTVFYTGGVTIADGMVELVVNTERHTLNPAIETVFGADRARLILRGPAEADPLRLNGAPEDAPELLIMTELAWLSD